MNTKAIQRAIRALGITATRMDGEWRVNYPKPAGTAHDFEQLAYYTEDSADALATAQVMAATMASLTLTGRDARDLLI